MSMIGKIKIILLATALAGLVILTVFFVVGYFKPQKAGLIIETNPASMVFINAEQVGRTRYETTRNPGDIVVKLVPESVDKPLAPYETKIALVAGVKTIIQRDFGDSEDTSSGVIVSFEKAVDKETSISVISIPDSAQVTIDGQVRGFAPFKSSSIVEGEHTLTVGARDYVEKSIDIRTYKGYKLTAIFKLAPIAAEVSLSPSPTASPEPEVNYVEILETSTGYLRVRSEPSTLAPEVAQVDPGKKYKLLDTDEKTGWFKIEYQPASDESQAKSGWVTNQYAKKVESGAALPKP